MRNLFRKDPLSAVPIKYKLPLSFVLLCLIAFGVAGYLVANSVYRSLESEILSRLRSESIAHAVMFDKSMDALGRRSQDFASDGFIRTQTAKLVQGAASPARSALERHLRKNKLPLEPTFTNLLVFDTEGHLLAAAREHTLILKDRERLETVPQDLQFSALAQRNGLQDSLFFEITTPLRNLNHSEVIGYLSCVVDLSTVIHDTFAANRDAIAESSLEKHLTIIDAAGRRVNIPWWFPEEADRTASYLTHSGGLFLRREQGAQRTTEHVGRHTCEHGQEMYGQSYPMESVGWIALVELNAEAALLPITAIEGKILGTAIIITITTLILLYFPVQFLIRPLNALKEMASRIKDGDFSVRLQTESEDEIGHLTKTFNMMAAAVEERTTYLEETARDLQQSQQELRIEHHRLETVVQSMEDGLILLGRDGEIILSNAAARPVEALLTGEAENPAVQRCRKDGANDGNCVACLLNGAAPHSCIVRFDQRIYEILSTRLPTESGETGKILVARDITEREQMRDQQLHQDRLAVLGRIAAVVAHEMNSPLSAISMYNQMMETELPEDSPYQEHVDVIQRNTRSCRRIIKQLLDYARTPQPEISEVNINELITTVLRFLKPFYEQKDILLDYQNLCGNRIIQGDAMQLQQVLVNLIMNAIQALPGEDGRIEIRADQKDNQITIDIRDNGQGIPADKQEEIFAPFVTTRSAGGTGLGLPTARRIIRAHRGRLELLTSEPGNTVFRIALPLKTGPDPSWNSTRVHTETEDVHG